MSSGSWLLRTFRGRYLTISILLVLVLIAVAVTGWWYVEQRAVTRIPMIEHRTQAADLAAELEQQVRTVESRIHRALVIPNQANRTALKEALALEQSAAARLRNADWVGRQKGLSKLVAAIQRDSDELRAKSKRLIQRRRDVEAWFPAMQVMQSEMLPESRAFFQSLDLALSQARDLRSDETQRQLWSLLNRLSRVGRRMRSEFRLLVANRFGIFSGQPEDAMEARAYNIEIFAGRLETLLEQVSELKATGQLRFQQDQAISDMRARIRAWRDAYKKVADILGSEEWRTDTVYLEEKLDPLLERIYQRLSTFQLEVKVASARDITHLTEVARHLVEFVGFLAVAGVLTILAGYVVTNRVLLNPIWRITQALKAEAQGSSRVPVPRATTEETRNLVAAFDEMREKVRRRQERLDHLAHHDPLTQLPNRLLFRDRLNHALAMGERHDLFVGLMFMDLDQFKQINDSLGHEIGDRLLMTVSERLKKIMRRSDTIARLGGDEFAIILEDVTNSDQVYTAARKILGVFDEPFWVGGREFHVTVSIGIALAPTDATQTDVLVKYADAAMYYAKEVGRNTYKFYSTEITARAERNLALEMALRRAVRDREFDIHYQPIIEATTGRISACEALLRWPGGHNDMGPAQFVPVLEALGLIGPVTEWIIGKVSADFNVLEQRGGTTPTIAINLSGQMLYGSSGVDSLINAVRDSGWSPERVLVEVTEEALIKDMQAAKKALNSLQAEGVRVALDDFGTGQSSLNHLRRFPVDVVKIDRDFVGSLEHDAWDRELVTSIIKLAHGRGAKAVAEGVETQEQAELLAAQGCDCLQGFWFSKPLPLSGLRQFLEAHPQSLPAWDWTPT